MHTTDRRIGREAHRHGAPGKRRFIVHYVEMVVAMPVGMLVLGGAVRGALALGGVEYGGRSA